ncbi:MAG: polysaccharide deacetylase family protein, partial [Clostridia bacterium]|nr:polysaccharide deacetylase family protein [Clostridia bacterium]
MPFLLMRYPEGKAKAVTLSYDDNHKFNLHLMEIIDRYGVKCTFNVNSGSIVKNADGTSETCLSPADLQTMLDHGHEIAVHGAAHVAPGMTPLANAVLDDVRCREELEKLLGRIIRGMAYPNSGIRRFYNGATYNEVRNYLKAMGVVYARSLGADNDRFELPDDWYNWCATAHHGNGNIFSYIDKFLALDPSRGYPNSQYARLFYVWGHSFEFENSGNWDRLEEICQKLGGHDDIWYATNIEIYDYVEAFRAMQTSMDNRIFYNPTCTTLFF